MWVILVVLLLMLWVWNDVEGFEEEDNAKRLLEIQTTANNLNINETRIATLEGYIDRQNTYIEKISTMISTLQAQKKASTPDVKTPP